jgi:hypothetical protein
MSHRFALVSFGEKHYISADNNAARPLPLDLTEKARFQTVFPAACPAANKVCALPKFWNRFNCPQIVPVGDTDYTHQDK